MRRARRAGLVIAAATGIGAAGVGGWVAWPLPDGLLAPPPSATVSLLDRNGRALRLARAADGTDTRWIALSDVDADVIRAAIALEDNRFYRHAGVDPAAALRAARDNLRAGRVVSGASTITMQLARLVVPARRTLAGKLRQTAWALRLEAHLSKQQILEQYLNRLPLGAGAVGVGAAADRYFAASPGRLSLAESTLLVSLARAPTRQNPLADAAKAGRLRATALGRLRARGMITERDSARAAAEPVVTPRGAPFDAPHFTTMVLSAMDRQGGRAVSALPVATTLDLSLQAELESEVRHTVASLADRGARGAAAVVLDNATGGVLAWVGSPDFFDPEQGQVDMVTSPRQPGSALKPFLYGLAFDHGYSPASVLPDVARTYATAVGPYSPRNYDRRFHGPVTAREGLASSHNVPAVELTDRLGVAALHATLHRAGFASLGRPPDHYGLGLALGNGDVTLIELANGYRALANEGWWTPWEWSAAAAAGAAVRSAGSPDRRSVVSPVAAALVLDILADPVARIPGFGTETPFDLPFPTAVKTGTSRNFTDNWAVAVTGGFTVAVWVGDAAGRPMERVGGITGAGPLLQRAVLRAARHHQPGVLPVAAAAGARAVRICRVSGGRPGPDCPAATEWIPPGARLDPCAWHRGEGLVLPVEYTEWIATTAGIGSPAGAVPASSGLRILSPLDGDRYSVPPGVDPRYATVALRAASPPGAGAVRWLVDGRPVAGERWRLRPGVHTVRAVTGDGTSDEVRIVVE